MVPCPQVAPSVQGVQKFVQRHYGAAPPPRPLSAADKKLRRNRSSVSALSAEQLAGERNRTRARPAIWAVAVA
jgi:hypothetical protein